MKRLRELLTTLAAGVLATGAPDPAVVADVARRIGLPYGGEPTRELSGTIRGIAVRVRIGARRAWIAVTDPLEHRDYSSTCAADAQEIAAWIAEALTSARRSQESFCENATRGAQMFVRRFAVRKLAQVPLEARTPETVEQLHRSATTDSNERVRLAAAVAIGDRALVGADPTWLLRLLEDDEEATAIEAAVALGLVGAHVHLAPLNAAARRARPAVARAIAEAIASIEAREGSSVGGLTVVGPGTGGALSPAPPAGALSDPKKR